MLAAIFAQAEVPTVEQVTRDSAILGEQFYFLTVVLMWLIHAGFMSYEAGVARRKNVMATAMKNILTIAVVTPTFYYFGWWIYNCNQAGLPIGPNSSDFTSVACQAGIPWSDAMGPNLRTTSTSSSSWRSCCSAGRRRRSCPARSSSASGCRRT